MAGPVTRATDSERARVVVVVVAQESVGEMERRSSRASVRLPKVVQATMRYQAEGFVVEACESFGG